MSPPLPLPSKAAVRALRSLALGTSCAIGAIVEDRRRRISTLKTAVANKEKLKSSRHYHQHSLEQLVPSVWSLDDAALVGPEDCRLRRNHIVEKPASNDTAPGNTEIQATIQDDHTRSLAQLPPPSTSPPPQFINQLQSSQDQHRYSVTYESTSDGLISNTVKPPKTGPAVRPLLSIKKLLSSPNSEKLDRAVALFLSRYPTFASSPQGDKWLALSLRLSQECESRGQWSNISHLLAHVIKFGALTEAQYFTYNPGSTIEFLLRRSDPEVSCSEKSVDAAARIYLVELEDRKERQDPDMERSGWLLLNELLTLRHFTLALRVYWRILSWSQCPEDCASSAIRTFHEHSDHKTVVKIFLLHYCRLTPAAESFNQTMDCVIKSVEALAGLNADSVLNAITEMKCPRFGKMQTRWIMQLLRAYWARNKNISKTQEIFENAVHLGLLNKVNAPEAVYRSMIEIAVKAGDADMADWYADKVIHDYPNMKDEVALKIVELKATAGDWNGVLSTFSEVQTSALTEATTGDIAFTAVLKVFAESHSANATRDFVMLFQEIGVRFHSHTVTLVAKKYGQARDMEGLVAWLELCSQQGFALHPGFCNSVLHSCRAEWEMSFPELRVVYAKFKALNPYCSDEVTRRIMSQAAHRTGHGLANVRPGKLITVNRLAYLGRWTKQRDVLEVMNQELMNGKPATAVNVYRRARRYGMPFSSHCLRLAVLAALRAKQFGSSAALSMIRDAKALGHQVEPAVAIFLTHQIDAFVGSVDDVMIHMRNLISRFESWQVSISPAVLTYMATTCVKIGDYEKAIALCCLARDRSGSPHLCFSRQGFKALASAYLKLLDIDGMSSLIDSTRKSGLSADKGVLLHLKSVHRLAKKLDESPAQAALLKVIQSGIHQFAHNRSEVRAEGKLISHRVLEIVGDAVKAVEARQPEKNLTQACTTAFHTEQVNSPTSIVQQEVAVG
ncbi:hypothetical protein NPX13_g1151 [Xylaria arbuscula]|uniref:Pentacotripeptide-repeat region of PRORP domain-containing protein n=1 Tax=Xylaria arbuscula TaxID=114810 RepID=A0A9W8NMK8_9PEZI|nr:hypothetical protein NPX13_g1151 [Xylaria arbuscula]